MKNVREKVILGSIIHSPNRGKVELLKNTLVLINTDGTIYSKHLGYERGDEIALEKEIAELIEYNKTISVTDEVPDEKHVEEK